jgi:peptidyl-prolyl cis-trans isomerase A (cyclophilin A)
MKAFLTGPALQIVLCTTLLASNQISAQTPAPKSTPTHTAPAAAHPSLLHPATLHAKAPAVYKAQFTTTTGGVFVVEVHRDWAPLGADRFYNLVRNGFFTNAAFFRVVPGFIVQFGLSANPAVNKVWHDAHIADDPVTQSNKRGTLTFATAGPNTRTTQLFINFADNARLDKMGFAPFGTVIQGIDVVDKIYAVYGELPQQDQIVDQGDAYLKAHFPDLDKIKLARILPPTPAPGAAHPAPKPTPKPAAH